MGDEKTDEAPGGDEDPRLTSLEERLRKAHHSEAERTTPKAIRNPFSGKGVSQGQRVLSAMVGTPLGGLIVGFAIDEFLGSRPKAMLAMLFLGMVAGIVQVWITETCPQEAVEPLQFSPSEPVAHEWS